MHVIDWNRCSDFAQDQYARQTVGIITWCRYTKNFSDSWGDPVWTVWFETPDAILIAIRRFEELNLYLLGYDFENYQVSFHQEINRCTKIVTPNERYENSYGMYEGGTVSYQTCHFTESSFIWFGCTENEMFFWHRARFSLLFTCMKDEVDVHFVKGAY